MNHILRAVLRIPLSFYIQIGDKLAADFPTQKGDPMAIADSLVMELEMEAKTTRRVLERIPEDKLAWKPHDTSMTLGQLASHVANAQGFLTTAASADSFEFGSASLAPAANTRAEILDSFTQNTAKAKDLISKMDDARLMGVWTATMKGKTLMAIPRVGAIRVLVMNHTYHHRGQLSVYLRMLDVPIPSIYGPSKDENPFS
jgi:uncharacterized damage-inducible protein DinB